MLERDFGWSGTCIEANPAYQIGYGKRRCKTVVAAVGSPTDLPVAFTFRGVFGGIVGSAFDNKGGEPGTVENMRSGDIGRNLRRCRGAAYH